MSAPVRLYTTVAKSEEGLRFPMLHAKDGARLQQRYACVQCGEEVAAEQTVRGYEHAKGSSSRSRPRS